MFLFHLSVIFLQQIFNPSIINQLLLCKNRIITVNLAEFIIF